MKTPTSVVYRTAMYLHHVKGQRSFTAKELHNAARDAQTWYNDHLSHLVKVERTAILERHGFTETTWCIILAHSRSFYFSPTDEIIACNDELRQLMSRQFIINSLPRELNYTHACVSNAFKRGVLTRWQVGVYRYSINPDYITHANFPEGD